MANRKRKILNTSIKLFNKHGYSNVSIRMIALKLGISSGNLTYHFNKREDLLEAIYFEMVEEFDSRVVGLKVSDISLENTLTDILHSMERMVYYRFFWTDLYDLIRLNKKIGDHFKKAEKRRIKGYGLLFDTLIHMGLLCPFEFKKERVFLIDRMIDFSNTWIYNSLLYKKKISNRYIEEQANCLLSMFYPYLSKSGKKEFRCLCCDFFD